MRNACSPSDIAKASASASAQESIAYGFTSNAVGELARRTRELAEHQHAPVIIARADEFLRHQVHAVMQTADVTEIGGPQEAVNIRRVVMRFEQDDRPIAVGTKPAIDAIGSADDPCSDLAIGRETLAARLRDLDEHESLPHLGVGLEQALDRQKFLSDPFRVIQPIDADSQSMSSPGMPSSRLTVVRHVSIDGRCRIGGLSHSIDTG